jgi:hypothetical protein
MEREGSIPRSQISATYPCPEPARSSPYLHIPLPENPSTPGSSKWFLPSGFPPKPSKHLSPYVLHAPPISLFSILSPKQYWVSSTDQHLQIEKKNLNTQNFNLAYFVKVSLKRSLSHTHKQNTNKHTYTHTRGVASVFKLVMMWPWANKTRRFQVLHAQSKSFVRYYRNVSVFFVNNHPIFLHPTSRIIL